MEAWDPMERVREARVIVDGRSTDVIERLCEAINRHDLEAVLDCFHADVRSEQPTRPDRGYRGRDELRGYWEQVLCAGGDFQAKLLRCAADERHRVGRVVLARDARERHGRSRAPA